MAGFASSYITVSKIGELQKVGKNNTSLLKLQLMEPIRKKEDGEWKTIGHNFFEAEVWGDKASEAALDLREDTTLDLSPTIEENKKGEEWIKYRARLDDDNWEYKGKQYHKAKVKIFDYKIRD